MRDAYFSVGEEVILKSISCPHLNGPAVVLERSASGKRKVHFENGSLLSSLWGYRLDIDSPGGLRWNESALRKKHKPSEFTFEQLIKQEVPA